MNRNRDLPVLVVTGTMREAAVLDQLGVEVIAGGSDPEGLAQQLAERAPYCAGIVSFGMAGGIDHTLKVGDWVIGKRVTGAFHTKCDEAWVNVLRARLPRARVGAVHADGRLFADTADKAERAWASAALAADMESHIAAEAAAHANLPFVVLRCISDGAQAQLPPAVGVMMRPDGGLDVGAVLKSVVEIPAQIPALASTMFGFAKAYGELKSGARKVGHRLGFDDRAAFTLA
ncbi:MAG TPA: phosphorylase [Novosphingobium sp.]|nr:phosphorylase [Novosphingobium sp.]